MLLLLFKIFVLLGLLFSNLSKILPLGYYSDSSVHREALRKQKDKLFWCLKPFLHAAEGESESRIGEMTLQLRTLHTLAKDNSSIPSISGGSQQPIFLAPGGFDVSDF